MLEKLASARGRASCDGSAAARGRAAEGRRYEIFHDVLGEPILEWRREFERAREQEEEARRQRAGQGPP